MVVSPVKPPFAIAEPRWSIRYAVEWIDRTFVTIRIRPGELRSGTRDRLGRKGHGLDAHLLFESRPMLRSKAVHSEL